MPILSSIRVRLLHIKQVNSALYIANIKCNIANIKCNIANIKCNIANIKCIIYMVDQCF